MTTEYNIENQFSIIDSDNEFCCDNCDTWGHKTVQHLQSARSGGKYLVYVPDKIYCGDCVENLYFTNEYPVQVQDVFTPSLFRQYFKR